MSPAPDIHSNDPLTIIGARMHYNELPLVIQKKLDSFEHKMVRAFRGKRTLDDHFKDTLESLFNLRLQLFVWFSTQEISVEHLKVQVRPQLDDLCKDPLVGQIGFLVNRALDQNNRLIESLSENLESSVEELRRTPHVPKIKFDSFISSLFIMGADVLANVIVYSLYFEMIAVSALLIHKGKIKPGITKLEELILRAQTDVAEYCKYAGKFREGWTHRRNVEEKADYELMASQSFNSFFAEDEPDYGDVEIRNPNPDFRS
jgi:hypothetical protein